MLITSIIHHNQMLQKNKLEAVELRLDHLELQSFDEIFQFMQDYDVPVVIKHCDAVSIETLKQLAPEYIDIDYKNAQLIPQIKNSKVILSYHDFNRTPEDLLALAEKLAKYQVDVIKIATYAQSSADALRMLVLMRIMRERQIPFIGICMGEKGQMTRTLSGIYGSGITFVNGDENSRSAEGQLTAQEMQEIYRCYTHNVKTRVYALIGNPVKYSVGHLFHNREFKKRGLNSVYERIHVEDADEMNVCVALMRELNFAGLSVTMPFKREIVQVLDEVKDGLEVINTVVSDDKKWLGSNTDGVAVLDLIEERFTVKGKTLAVLGAGGASEAVLIEASKRGARLKVLNRTLERAKLLAKKYACDWGALGDLGDYDVLIQGTPLGMGELRGESPVNFENLLEKRLVVEMVREPAETQFVKDCRRKGCEVILGDRMFERQALGQQVCFNP